MKKEKAISVRILPFLLSRLQLQLILHHKLWIYAVIGNSLRALLAFSIFSINIPYPSVGLATITWVTAPTSLPLWTMGLPLMSVVKKGQQNLWVFLLFPPLFLFLRPWVNVLGVCPGCSMLCILSLHNCDKEEHGFLWDFAAARESKRSFQFDRRSDRERKGFVSR